MPKSNRGRKVKDITGERFGLLTAIRFSRVESHGAVWEFQCQCGTVQLRLAHKVKTAVKMGREPKCRGCNPAVWRHGMSDHPAYASWKAMMFRCSNENHADWKNYGGRGIAVCDSWFDFLQFWSDMGPSWMQGLTLDRIDNEAGYSAGNCRWATRTQQGRNKRGNRVIITPRGEMTIAEASEAFGISSDCLRYRLNRGMSVHTAVLTPSGGL